MRIKSFPYKWTFVVGVAFLGSLLWSVTFGSPASDILVFLFLACLLLSLVASVALGLTIRSKDVLYRVLTNVAFLALFFPTVSLGRSFRERLFLMHLPKFQEVTNFLIRDEIAKTKSDQFSDVVSLPPGYSDLNVLENVLISSSKQRITVHYAMQGSSAFGHYGYAYRSDDSAEGLSKEFPNRDYRRIAPYWFFFSE